jgi:hypothetical protein
MKMYGEQLADISIFVAIDTIIFNVLFLVHSMLINMYTIYNLVWYECMPLVNPTYRGAFYTQISSTSTF